MRQIPHQAFRTIRGEETCISWTAYSHREFEWWIDDKDVSFKEEDLTDQERDAIDLWMSEYIYDYLYCD